MFRNTPPTSRPWGADQQPISNFNRGEDTREGRRDGETNLFHEPERPREQCPAYVVKSQPGDVLVKIHRVLGSRVSFQCLEEIVDVPINPWHILPHMLRRIGGGEVFRKTLLPVRIGCGHGVLEPDVRNCRNAVPVSLQTAVELVWAHGRF